MKGSPVSLLVLGFCQCLVAPAAAGVFNAVLENDAFAFAHTDYHYTSGALFNYLGGRDETPDVLRQSAASFPLIDSKDDIRLEFYLGHQIFTPDDIHSSDLLHEERPYAGYLFAGTSVLATNLREVDSWSLTIGAVGPRSRAEKFQTSIHGRLGANVARGWNHQLRNETVFQFDYLTVKRKAWRPFKGLQMDLLPFGGFALGNAATHADVGLSVRLGQSLGSDFGPARMRPALPGSTFISASGSPGWYGFFGVGGRHVIRNLFLDGNTRTASHQVEKNMWVGDVQAGFVMHTKRYRLAYTFVARSREYRSQKKGDKFGALTLSLKL